MRTHTLFRLGGLAAVLAGVLSIAIEIVLFLTIGKQPLSTAALTAEWSVLYLLRLLSIMLLVFGLFALYARQRQKMGAFGAVAFVIASMGTTLILGFAWALIFVFPVMAETVPEFLDSLAVEPGIGVILSLLLGVTGWFLFGIASLRAKILPPGSIWLVILGSILALGLNIINAPFGWVVLDIGLIWMGWWLWSERVQST